jgi:hypothetical protein
VSGKKLTIRVEDREEKNDILDSKEWTAQRANECTTGGA